MTRILVTGSAGFIGFHLCRLLLDEGFDVHGLDGMTPYYDVSLKQRRHALLRAHPRFGASEVMLEDRAGFDAAVDAFAPDVIVHLAAQAGVRYSLEAPRSYLDSNVTGTFNVIEAARRLRVRHLLISSSSSVYGANKRMPFTETDRTATPLSIYAATKMAGEALAHSYAHLWDIPTTMFRFFTVYGAWGRPDLAYFKFTEAILAGRPIDVYNNGQMFRDFTYVGDLVRGIRLLVDAVPVRPGGPEDIPEGDGQSPAAPYRVVNIGTSRKIGLMEFIAALEEALGRKAVCNFMEMQKGDVPATWADSELLHRLTGFRPQTDLRAGLAEFVEWYRSYYEV